MQKLELFNEKKEQLIKVISIDHDTQIAYIISTLLNIMNNWRKCRIYVYDISEGDLNDSK